MLRVVSCLLASALMVGGCSSQNLILGDAGGDAARPCATSQDCDDGRFCNGVETCAAGACRPGTAPCAAPRICDEALDACTGCTVRDADMDGVASMACGGADCDDTDANRFPGNTEVCDVADHDEDCDPTTFGVRDADGDSEPDAACCNTDGTHMNCGSDCDDTRASVSPRLVEICDSLDNDCDTAVDEGTLLESWPDADGDGFGEATATPEIVCAVPSFRASVGGDCNDTNGEVHPMQPELCNNRDDDCNGMVDDGADAECMGGVTDTTAACFSGHCRILGCADGSFDCNGNWRDGCEHLCTSSADCGSCGRVCVAPFTTCTDGHCGDYATASTTMTLRDAETGAPIAGATITTLGLCPSSTSTTRADGTYDLTNLEFAPQWVRIEAPGYPTHVQYADGNEYGPILPASLVDAWALDPDAATPRASDRAIVVIDYPSPSIGANHDDAVLGPANEAVGSDLRPTSGPGARQVYLGAYPGRTDVGGDATDGAGCTTTCGAVRRLWLEPGAVTLIHDGMSCAAFCI